MLDIKYIRERADEVQKLVEAKQRDASIASILEKDKNLRNVKTQLEKLKSKKNSLSKQIGQLKRQGLDAKGPLDEAESMASEIEVLVKEQKFLQEQFDYELSCVPNIPMKEVKISHDPAENVCLKTHGKKRAFDFPFKNHMELNENLDIFDFGRSAKISGNGWPLYKGVGAKLEWALIQYMFNFHQEKGFTPYLPPLLTRPEVLYGAGQLPKFETQLFRLHDEQFDLCLLPTAEVALNGLHQKEILNEEALPLKYVAYTPCFRREAGAAGATERGLIRMHQFNKVEMFCFAHPEKSKETFEEMLQNAEEILQTLGLHYKVMLLVSGDTSFASAYTIDLEVFLPGQDRYYEVSSISNCTDFQARRSQTRFKCNGKNEFVHTLNGSGLATSRLLVSLLENGQNADGSIELPEVLWPYLGGLKKIEPKN